jgi:hypothetical protein
MHIWSKSDSKPLYLITPDELKLLPDGFVLGCIDGHEHIIGKDVIDDDTRGGYLAYGIRDPENHPQKDQIMWFLLKLKDKNV